MSTGMTASICCPKCEGQSIVLRTTASALHTNTAHRRRKCIFCDHRFNTLEQEEECVLAEAYIIITTPPDLDAPFTTVVDDVSKIGDEVARICGPRTYPATIHHWQLHRSINGAVQVEWRKQKVFKWP